MNNFKSSSLKKGKKIGVFAFFAICLFFGQKINAQTVASPCDASPFCSDSSYNFPNTSGNTIVAPPSPPVDYGVMGSEPNPVWYYMQIGVAGSIQLNVYQTSMGMGTDVDFAMWGPFADVPTGCAAILAGAAPIQSSYDGGGAGEVIGLGLPGGTNVGLGGPPIAPGGTTPPDAQVGEVYIVILTNYANSPGEISFGQTDGTGQADCGVICGLHASNNGPVCANKPFMLSATNADSSISYTYEWTGPGGFVSNLKNPVLSLPLGGTYTFNVRSISINGDTCSQPTDIVIIDTSMTITEKTLCEGESFNFLGREFYKTGIYDSLFTNVAGCDSISRLQLTVNPLPELGIKGSKNVEICEGSSTILSLIQGQAGVAYQWYKDNYPVSGETGSQISVTQAGQYKVEGTTTKGCTATSEIITVKVNPNPVAGIEPISNDVICAYDTLELSAVTGTGDDYQWSPAKPFRIITGAEGEKVKGVFIDPVTVVTMTVYNQFGCYDTASVVVATKPCCEVFIPNAFSPNGDGLNEYFNPQLQPGQILLTMQVFDRYGKLVYNNTNIKKGWDGRYEDGSEASSNVYMYFVKYTCSDGKLYEKKESVSLIR